MRSLGATGLRWPVSGAYRCYRLVDNLVDDWLVDDLGTGLWAIGLWTSLWAIGLWTSL